MTHGSLFSGIGGFDLAAEWMGWENVFHCEWKEFNQKILKYYWPDAISYTDITKTDFTPHWGAIDILTGGFPCQPYSVAGKRKGKEDDRHLWPEMLRAVREIQPSYIVGENVGGIVSWSGGLVFEEVQSQMEAEGYEVQAFILPACAVNAPHRRDRVWFIAYSENFRHKRESRRGNDRKEWGVLPGKFRDGCQFIGGGQISSDASNTGAEGLRSERENAVYGFEITSNSIHKRLQRDEQYGEDKRKDQQWRTRAHGAITKFHRGDNWAKWPTQSPICNGDDGLSSRLDSITFPKWRSESIQAGGNAIVPQVALQMFKAIQEIESTSKLI